MDRRDFLRTSGKMVLGLVAMSAIGRPKWASGQTPIWFNTLFHGGDAGAMQIIVKKFNEEHKDIRIDLTQGGWTEYYAQLYNAVVAGVAPNLGICHDFRFASTHPALIPLEESPIGNLLEIGGIKKDDYISFAWEFAQYNGKQYGVPLDENMLGLYYNREIFEKAGLDPSNPPDTREEFEKACEAIKKTGKYAFHPALSGAPRWVRRAWYILYWQKEGELIEGGKAAFNNRKGVEALEYLVDMVQKRGWNKAGTDGYKQFLAGELGMCFHGTFFFLTVEKIKINYGFHYVPKFFEKRATWGTTHNLVVPVQPKGKAHEEKIRTTIKVLKWISENSYLWGQYGGHVPMYIPALKDERLKKSRTWKMTLEKFSDMAFKGVFKSMPRHPKIVEINAAIQPFIQNAYNGTISAKEALAKAEKEVNKVLKG